MFKSKVFVRLLVFIFVFVCSINAFAQYEQEKVIDFLIKIYDRHQKNLQPFLIDELHHYLKTFPVGYYSAYALHHLGKTYEENGDIAESMASYVKVLFLYPESPHNSEWANFIKTIVSSADRFPSLKWEVNEVNKIEYKNKSLPDRYFEYLSFLVTLNHPALGEWTLSNCREYIQLFPNDKRNDQILFWMANIYNGMGKQREANVSYLKFEILYPESVLLPQCLLRRSRILSDKFKQYEQAIELLNRIVTEFPDSKIAGNALLFMANIKEKKQKAYKEAVADYRKLVDNYPRETNVIEALFTIAKINFEKLKNYSNAISAYNEIVDKDTTQLDALIALEKVASIYKNRLKNMRKTVETYERIADINMNYKKAANKLYLAGSICESDLKDDQKAIYYYQLFLEKYPNHKKALDVRVKIQHIQKRLTAYNLINIDEQKTASLISDTQ